MRSIEIGIQRQIGLDPFETRDDAGQGAHVLSESRDRGPRGNGPVTPTRHDQFAAGSQFDRDRRAARVAQFLAAAARTLRAGRHVMLHDG